MLNNLILFSTIFIIIIWFFKKLNNKSSIKNQENKLVEDFSSQKDLYNKKRKLDKDLSEDQKIELSWQFLYDITDYVLKKFSKQDIESVHDIGKKLVGLGVTYQHVVEYGITSYNKNNAKLISEEKNIINKKQSSL